MSHNISDLCGKRISLHELEFDYNDFVGIEQELENIPKSAFRGVVGVTATNDGSLRGDYACEVVSEVTPASKLRYILQHVERVAVDWCNDHEISVDDLTGERTSTHVHLNMTDVTTDDVKKMVLVYMAVEPYIFASMFPNRESNRFCVPCYSAAPEVQFMNLRSTKYCALNLRTLSRFGTMEFRHMGGNISVESIVHWVKIILRLKHIAINKSMDDLLNLVASGGVPDLVFGVGHNATQEQIDLGISTALRNAARNSV